MTTTTHEHTFSVGEGPVLPWGFLAIAIVVGATIGFGVSWASFTAVPSIGGDVRSAIHSPVMGMDTAEIREELERAQHQLQMNETLVITIQEDPRWADPAQREGVIDSLESTLSRVAEQEAYIEALEMRLGALD